MPWCKLLMETWITVARSKLLMVKPSVTPEVHGCLGRGKGRTLPEWGRTWTLLGREVIHPSSPSNLLPCSGPQIWVRTSGRWEGIEVWSDKPQVQRRKRPQDRLLLQGTLKTVPTLGQIEIIFMQIPTRALLVASGKKASSEGKELLTSLWKVAQSCPTLCDPWTVAHQAPPSVEFPRQE